MFELVMMFLLKALVALALVAIIALPLVWGLAFIICAPLYIIGDLLGWFRDEEPITQEQLREWRKLRRLLRRIEADQAQRKGPRLPG